MDLALRDRLWFHSLFLTVAFAMVCTPFGSLIANGSPTAKGPSAESTTPLTAAQLIEQLGAPRFSTRERATQQLIQCGPAVLSDIQVALDHDDAEIRRRAQSMYVRLKQTARVDQLQSFLTHPDRKIAADETTLPGWNSLRELVGDTPESRQLLAAMLHAHWEVIEAFEAMEADREKIVSQHIQQLRAASRLQRDHLTVASITAALLMAQNSDSTLPDSTISNLLSLLHQLSAGRKMPSTEFDDPWKHPPFRELVSRVLVRCTTPAAAWQSFSLALHHDLEAAMTPALAILEEPEAKPHIRQYALLTIAKFGDERNVEKIKSLLDDTTICYRREHPRTKESQFECQVRDVALATMIHLTSKDPRQFGFAEAKLNAYCVYAPTTLGFANDEERHRAYEKWQNDSGKEDGG